MEKKEIIAKLKNLNNIYKKSLEAQNKIENVKVKDNYERVVVVPEEPACPLEVEEPIKEIKTKSEFVNEILGPFFVAYMVLGLMFASFIALRNVAVTIFSVVLIGISITCHVLMSKKRALKYDDYVENTNNQYKEDLNAYKEYLTEVKLYNKEINTYNRQLKLHEEEEKEIRHKINEEENRIKEEIIEKEYDPLVEKLEKENDGIIGKKYYEDLLDIIDLLESGRADTIKEALNLFEDIKQKNIQFELDLKFRELQLNLEQRRIEQEAADRAEAKEREESINEALSHQMELNRRLQDQVDNIQTSVSNISNKFK